MSDMIHSGWLGTKKASAAPKAAQGHYCQKVERRHTTVFKVGRNVVSTPREKLDTRCLMAAPGHRCLT